MSLGFGTQKAQGEVNPVMVGGENKKRALGRGLSALIPQAGLGAGAGAGAVPVAGELPTKDILRLPIEAIHRDPGQPRKHFDETKLKELADSIRAQGLIQPILVRKEGAGYRLIAGERRWRAAQRAGLTEIPALVKDVSAAEAFELALVENLQRADLNPIEEAEGYKRLTDEFGLTQEKVSERVGKDRSSVANALRLLSLPAEVKTLVASGELAMGHARALLGIQRPAELTALAAKVASQKLSVRDTERLVKDSKDTASAKKGQKADSASAKALVEELQRALGTKVRLVDRGGKGTIEVDFYSYADLDRLVALFRR